MRREADQHQRTLRWVYLLTKPHKVLLWCRNHRFPVTHAKDPLVGIPAPPCSLGHKSFFNLFSHLHVHTPTPPNLWKIPSWKKSAQSRLESSAFPLAKPIKRTSLASKAWITGYNSKSGRHSGCKTLSTKGLSSPLLNEHMHQEAEQCYLPRWLLLMNRFKAVPFSSVHISILKEVPPVN